MTLLGHSLFGAALGVAFAPRAWSHPRKAAFVVACATLATVPDFALPRWGHERYDVSHSVFVNGGLAALAALVVATMALRLRHPLPGRLLLTGGLAWLSHLVLDALYAHGKGIAIFWPFGRGRLNLSLPWFETLDRGIPLFSPPNLRVFLVELVAFGTLLGVVCLVRAACGPHRASVNSSCDLC